jgi:uncharacterized protein
MTPFMFGGASRTLLGVVHENKTAALRGVVLLINPLGHESIRVHRMYRVLADRLARAGLTALRFDPYGTGDSGGSDSDLTLSGWSEDVSVAHQELRRRAPEVSISWVGCRLGASVAFQTAHRVANPPSHLVLWDPIINGADYLQLLREKHVEAMESNFGLIDPDWRLQLNRDANAFSSEAIGYALSEQLRNEIRTLHLDDSTLCTTARLSVFAQPDDLITKSWLSSIASKSNLAAVDAFAHDFDWTAEAALNTALVPNHAIERIVSALGQ